MLFRSVLLVLCTAAAVSAAEVTRTVNFDSLPTNAAPPTPYKNLQYTNFEVINNKTGPGGAYFIFPRSKPNFLVATNPFYAVVNIANATAVTLKSFALACAGQVNGSPSTGYAPTACDVTVTSSFFIPAIPITATTVSYTPVQNPNQRMQVYNFNDTAPGGSQLVFSLSGGQSVQTFYIDNLVYTVQT